MLGHTLLIRPGSASDKCRHDVELFMSSKDMPRAAKAGQHTPLPQPTLFPGMSLAHNFHEIMLGTLVNSDGQDLLSSEVMPVRKNRKHSRTRRQSRQIDKIERCDRIPTWPVSNGLRCQALARFNQDLAAKLEHKIGGADCPNIWLANDDPSATSPFLMLVHHNHSFDLFDPARFIERELLPEGFPSHGHRGMTTVTICLRGGLVHRDSDGRKQVFGAETSSAKKNSDGPYGGKHTQWLTFGKGIIHELMFDNVRRRGQLGHRGSSILHQELYQIWIDLPSADRMMTPRVELLGGKDETPIIKRQGTTTTVIAGQHNEKAASVSLTSDLSILRVEMKEYSSWKHTDPNHHSTMIVYVRRGSIIIDGEKISAQCTAHLTRDGFQLKAMAGKDGADFLVLSGKPLGQNVVARGSMVSDTNAGLEKAFADYETGDMGTPWSERYSDDDWRRHVEKYG